jgi:hypothetical protein
MITLFFSSPNQVFLGFAELINGTLDNLCKVTTGLMINDSLMFLFVQL